MEETPLTPVEVHNLIAEAITRAGDDEADRVEVKGIITTYALNRGRLDASRGRIASLLRQLPDEFHRGLGGGMSFLNACMDRQGRQWTGIHAVMEALLVLGIATDQAGFCLADREMWKAMPGSMPYIEVHPDEPEAGGDGKP